MIGALVTGFTNDELRLLADAYLNMGEVATLRKLGLLQPDEGFGHRSRRVARHTVNEVSVCLCCVYPEPETP